MEYVINSYIARPLNYKTITQKVEMRKYRSSMSSSNEREKDRQTSPPRGSWQK